MSYPRYKRQMKYDQIRREKAKKLARVKGKEIIEKEPEKNALNLQE